MKNIAKLVSTIGNPLCLGIFYTFCYYLNVKNSSENPWMVWLSVGFVLTPMLVFVIYKVRKGDFADYDVSNRLKRKQVYLVFLVSLFILIVFSFVLKFPTASLKIQLAIFIQILVSFFINQRLKVSMHTSFSFLFAYLFFPLDVITACLLFGFGFINGASRVVLGRHSISEVVAGFILGNTIGLLYIYFI